MRHAVTPAMVTKGVETMVSVLRKMVVLVVALLVVSSAEAFPGLAIKHKAPAKPLTSIVKGKTVRHRTVKKASVRRPVLRLGKKKLSNTLRTGGRHASPHRSRRL